MMANTTVMVQPGAYLSPDGPKTNSWNSGVCDCCDDVGICCFGFWCPYCLMCKTTEQFGECLCLPLVEFCFGTLVPPVTFAMRSSVRERYRIQGTMADDCCVSTCCSLCVWCQMARELKIRHKPQVFINAPLNPAYQHPVPIMPQEPHPMMGH
ncbi:plac8 onzin related protein 6 [Hoplias malabaricus]|uniref:plac8 onzin related protein 6 n=1 Tax=Hoplias malabaricus TaxID=27720 RepID=UPI0034636DB6